MQRGTSPLTPEFDDLVNALLAEWHVPGTSIAIIDGPDTFTKGYGISKYPNTPATPQTLYYTASTTKSFTAAALSLLIDDAANTTTTTTTQQPQPLTWTTPLSSLIRSDFVLPDAYATQHITLEDALSHRTGLPEHSYHFRPDNSCTPKDEVRRLRHLPMTAAIRTKYMYNSFMYTAVSHAIETLTGRDLGVFLRERIWAPLHMDATYWTLRDAVASRPDELAGAYVWDASSSSSSSSPSSPGFVEIDHPEYAELSGAGCMISNVVDYAKWLRYMMAQSGPLSRAGHAALVSPRVVSMTGATNLFPGPHLYALGWRVDSYRGQTIVWHTGSIGGFGSVMMFLPGRDWGLVVMGNSTVTSNQMQQVLYMYLLDGLLGTPVGERVDWGVVIREKMERRRRRELASARERIYPVLPCPVLRPALEVWEYTGGYWHPGYGAMDLVLDVGGKALVADRRSQEFSMMVAMEHVSGEFWLARLQERYKDPRDYEVVRAEFRLGPEGVREVGVDLEPTMDGELIWFRRVD
ncbi:beta-lactamase/transpeptidase-like protein [Aspergillus pseudonomiae]|uniref:Beta-lactamase/transpeptidase-like protein n=1 Tax=Aspergillus pseudonomiae TaxID=1506151 RepID=A0A5N7DN73_9EURO|nr:beta-lactamase/transpeptidase-like protein [Aspergillus pseudonomiae]KAE8407917.1 beta-lactamase/transpeptidase-like protein [Aspergillus pseudonomiae]